MADAMVLATQKWLNEKYGNDSRFNKVAEEIGRASCRERV